MTVAEGRFKPLNVVEGCFKLLVVVEGYGAAGWCRSVELLDVECRSPIRRISEVMLLVFVTSSLWFLIAYASPCKDLPPQVNTTPLCSVLWHPAVRLLPHPSASHDATVTMHCIGCQ